jgi:uncharacterized YigZ family protein
VKIILKGACAEITEKKSRFIASVESVHSQDEADGFIQRTKKQFWDARHNCSAMILGERGEFSRSSDDGEPSGTAGRPMLSVLAGEHLTDVCVVVTRYFGGILLGTGGLVRAYSQAVQEALRACTIGERTDGFRLRIRTDYNGDGKIRYLLAQRQLPVTDTVYTDMVETETFVPDSTLSALKAEIIDKTNAKADFICEEKIRYALTDDGPVVL